MENYFENNIPLRTRRIVLLVLFLAFQTTASAQQTSAQITMTGVVQDDQGVPLPSASIVEKGTSNGVITDFDGNFEIQVSSTSQIAISFIGYNTKTIAATTEPVTVTLETNENALDEVVVVGYGQTDKKDITGSIASIDLSQTKDQPAANIGDAIQGRAPGVRVITSGQPGNNPTIRVRGIGTIGNNDPLIVVDGVPLNGGLNQINMRDVESMQILKDASSTAIYGSRGANGVVIITTKRGKNSDGQLNLETFSGFQEATNIVDVLNAEQFARLSNETLSNGGYTTNPDFSDPSLLGQGTDWLDALFQTGRQTDATLSYSNGGDKTNVYTSLNVFDQQGIIINTKYKRYIFQFNSDTKLSDNFRFGNSLKINYDRKEQGEFNIQNTILSLPTQPILRDNGNYSGPIGEGIYSGDIENPIGKANIVDQSTDGYNLQGNVYGEADFFENFTFKTLFGVEANFFDNRTWTPAYSWDTDIAPLAYLYEASNKSITLLWDNTLTYTKNFEDGSSLTGVIGTSAQENNFKFTNGSIQDFPSEQTQELNNGISNLTLNGSESEWSIFSYFGRLNYDFSNKYYLTATVRRDGSSRFGEGNKYGTFPSGSIAWRISEEKFLQNSSFINNLKLRAGYGVTGNQNIGNYSFASQYNTYLYNFNNTFVTAAVPTVLPNPNVQWESQKQWNVGLDASLFDQAVELTVDAYIKNTEDMLVPQAVPVTSGYSDIFVPDINAGSLRNKGIEVALSTRNFKTDDFSWTTDAVFSYYDNEVLNINSDTPLTTGGIGLNYNLARIQPGYPVNVFYGFVTDGIFQNQAEVDQASVQIPGNDPATSTAPGDVRFKDLNNDGIINDDDRTFIGNPNPEFTYSLNNTFTYGNFNLSLYFQGVYGNDIFNANRIYTENMSVTTNQTTAVLNRWTGAGTSNTIPRAVFGDPNNNTRPSDRYIENGSYLRLKNVNLSYNIPVDSFNQKLFESAQIYISGQNLFTISDYSGFDPEVGTNGIDNNTYPVVRTILLGVNVGF